MTVHFTHRHCSESLFVSKRVSEVTFQWINNHIIRNTSEPNNHIITYLEIYTVMVKKCAYIFCKARKNNFNECLDPLRLQGLPLMRASTCCKAVFRSSFGLCRRSQGLDDRRYVLESVGNKLNLVGLVQTRSEKSLCNRWMRV